VVVADIDTGIDYNHPDLYQNVWINQAEIPPSRMKNLVDYNHDGYISWRDLNDPRNQGPFKITDVNGDGRIDAADILAPMIKDANGNDTGMGGWSDGISEDGDTAHVDDLIGWNFVNNTNNPLDDHGHGTHTAGTIAAMGNNGVGVVGVAFNTQIMALKFLSSSGVGSDLGAAEAIEYAAAHGARVSNNSWGGSGNDPALSNAISDAGSKGEIFVAAAGNSATNTDVTPNYPSAFNLSNIIAVAAIASDGSLASFSNYGPTTVDVGAPGVSIYSTLPNNSYGYLSGTSMATPHVTGTVALVLAEHPTWTMSQVINQILSSTTPDPALAGKTVTGGIINAALAVGAQLNGNTPTLAAIPDQSIPAGQSGTVTLQGSDPHNNPLTYSAQAESLPYWLKQTYGIYEDPNGYYTNYRGQQEKYLRGTSSASNYSDPTGYWYYILPNGDLYEFTPPYTNLALTGALVAHLGSAVYNDPSLLWNASNSAVPATLSVTNNVLTITPNAGYTGTFGVVATDSNGQASASQSFRVTVVGINTPPTLAAIPGQSIPAGQSGTVTLQGSDPDGDTLTYSAQAQSLPYWLKQTYGIYEDPNGYYTSYRHQQEKYLRGKISADGYNNGGGDYWYYILPNGDLYEFTPPYTNLALTGALVAHLGTSVYNDPSLLWNAQNTAVPTTLGIAGNVLTITPNTGYTGTFVIIASVNDGQASVSQSFRVAVGVNTPPTLAAIPNQSIPAGQSGTVTLQGSDTDGDTLTYSAVAETLPYWLKQTYGLFEDPAGYYTNYRGQQEKYLRGSISADGYSDPNGYWYYILPNGDLYEFTPPYTNQALTGALVAHLGTAVYTDPSLLWNAQNTAVPTTLGIAGNVLTITPNTGYTGAFVIIASVNDGQASASQSFRVTVS
jgi:subtilisin family serine protease